MQRKFSRSWKNLITKKDISILLEAFESLTVLLQSRNKSTFTLSLVKRHKKMFEEQEITTIKVKPLQFDMYKIHLCRIYCTYSV